jgi:hypothetical protein
VPVGRRVVLANSSGIRSRSSGQLISTVPAADSQGRIRTNAGIIRLNCRSASCAGTACCSAYRSGRLPLCKRKVGSRPPTANMTGLPVDSTGNKETQFQGGHFICGQPDGQIPRSAQFNWAALPFSGRNKIRPIDSSLLSFNEFAFFNISSGEVGAHLHRMSIGRLFEQLVISTVSRSCRL